MSSSPSTGAVPLGEALTNADYVVLVADEGMRYLAASDAACNLLGYSREELLALKVPDLVMENDAAELFDDFVRDQAQRGTITLRRKDGRLVVATYDARETVVRGLSYYIAVLSPLPVDSRESDSSPRGSRYVSDGKQEDLEPERSLQELHQEGVLSKSELEVELARLRKADRSHQPTSLESAPAPRLCP